jgi:hypothetical protein
VIIILVATAAAPFWLRWSGVRLSFSQLCICSALSAVITISVVLIGLQASKRRSEEVDPPSPGH